VSLGSLPGDFKKLFTKLMNHVYSFKQNSRELVVKVLKVFADYESPSDHNIPSPDMPNVSGNVNVVPEMHVPEVLLILLHLFMSIQLFFVCFLSY
jgi:hypothetical protein